MDSPFARNNIFDALSILITWPKLQFNYFLTISGYHFLVLILTNKFGIARTDTRFACFGPLFDSTGLTFYLPFRLSGGLFFLSDFSHLCVNLLDFKYFSVYLLNWLAVLVYLSEILKSSRGKLKGQVFNAKERRSWSDCCKAYCLSVYFESWILPQEAGKEEVEILVLKKYNKLRATRSLQKGFCTTKKSKS